MSACVHKCTCALWLACATIFGSHHYYLSKMDFDPSSSGAHPEHIILLTSRAFPQFQKVPDILSIHLKGWKLWRWRKRSYCLQFTYISLIVTQGNNFFLGNTFWTTCGCFPISFSNKRAEAQLAWIYHWQVNIAMPIMKLAMVDFGLVEHHKQTLLRMKIRWSDMLSFNFKIKTETKE